jgi:hypothetical protein
MKEMSGYMLGSSAISPDFYTSVYRYEWIYIHIILVYLDRDTTVTSYHPYCCISIFIYGNV